MTNQNSKTQGPHDRSDNVFETVAIADLTNAVGGADPDPNADGFFHGAGQNRFMANGELEGSFAGFQIRGTGALRMTNTDYSVCLSKQEKLGATSEALAKACPLPTKQ